jgi:prepilin-type N-terminal cleavage/methylation domain-containing protein
MRRTQADRKKAPTAMKIQSPRIPSRASGELAFSMIEVLISVAIMGVTMVSLYAGMSSGFAVTKASRENLRATQIMLERMEGIRLFTWNQLCYSNWVPTSFTTSYYPFAAPGESTGITYRATISITNATLSPAVTYGDRMRAIVMTVYWTNYYGPKMTNKLVRSRSMTTYTARDGIQNYVYYN